MNVFVTGANGFIGRALCDKLIVDGYQVRGAVREEAQLMALPIEIEGVLVGDISPATDWHEALGGIDVVVHLAARVHVMDDIADDPLAEFRKVNTAGTLDLARQAVAAGVRRFVFVSTIKVNGEGGPEKGAAFSENDVSDPQDPYAVSKWEAEQGLMAIAEETGLEVVIIRPPLVYGPGVKANFRSLMKWVRRGVPLPLGAVHNKRSFVAVDNLVSFIIHCMDHPKAANEVFLISDGEDVSTTELLQKMARAFGKRTILLPVPVSLMTFVAGLLGKRDVAQRLCGSLQVDISKAREVLGWTPQVSLDEGLMKAVEGYKAAAKKNYVEIKT
jgi:nucleoside-diphosphate-sugar epimerase